MFLAVRSAFLILSSQLLQLKYQGNLMCLHYSQNFMTTWGHPFSSNVSNVRESKNFSVIVCHTQINKSFI